MNLPKSKWYIPPYQAQKDGNIYVWVLESATREREARFASVPVEPPKLKLRKL